MSGQKSVTERRFTFFYSLEVNGKIWKTLRFSRSFYLLGLLLVLIAYSLVRTTQHFPYTPLSVLKAVWLLGAFLLVTTFVSTVIKFEDWVRVSRANNGESKFKVIFQITTKGENKEAVARSVESALIWASRHLDDFEVWVVTDEGADLEFLKSTKVKVLYTPKDYFTRNGSKYKARALNYACELRRALGLNRSDVWVYFMDEESVVGEDTVLGIKDFINSKKAEIGHGLIVYPNFWGKNLLVSLADSLRPAQDVFFSTVETKAEMVSWLHGSHLLVRADVEEKVCWDLGETWGEDSEFGLEAQRKGFRIAWIPGALYEQSPFSLRDYFKQRRRWFFHSFNMLKKRSPLWAKAYYWVSTVGWLAGLPSFVISILNFLFPSANPFPYFGFASLAILYNLIFWYIIGLKLNLDPLNLSWGKELAYFALALLLFPVYTAMESLAAWYALLSWRKRNEVGFEVVKK